MLSPEAAAVLKARYLLGSETPPEMFMRVAKHVARAEERFGDDWKAAAKQYQQIMTDLEFLPNSPTLMNAGKPNAQLAACFVLPVEDSLAGIFETLKHAALIQQSGGGTGFSFSRLRPKGGRIATTGGPAGGPVSFMHVYNTAAQAVKQGAVRSGANMAVLRVDHPDIMEFIEVKHQRDVLNNFNLSVAVTDEFMAAVAEGSPFTLLDPHTKGIAATVEAREIYDRLVAMAWENGEPGLFFIDTVNRANPTPALGDFESPNPCSEQPLLPYESCTLGSVNLARMVKTARGQACLDEDKLRQVVRTAVRFLDNVIEINQFPLQAVAEQTRLTRKIGLGIMGLADLLIMLELPYASREAVQMTERVMKLITSEARNMSVELAVRRGSFPAFEASVFAGQGYTAMRNATVTTIAPAGSISIIGQCSSGIEPLFALAFTRQALDGRVLTSTNPVAWRYLADRGLLNDALAAFIKSTGSAAGTDLPAEVKAVLAVAHEIEPYWHVAHLAAAQRHTDNGVSKTVNLPKDAPLEVVDQIFQEAYRSGCKGVTVYRDTSRSGQVLTHGTTGCAKCEQ